MGPGDKNRPKQYEKSTILRDIPHNSTSTLQDRGEAMEDAGKEGKREVKVCF